MHPATIELRGSLISNCSATYFGGGIFAFMRAEVNVSDTQLAGNAAAQAGGAVYAWLSATVLITNQSLVTDNDADSGGGLFIGDCGTQVTDNQLGWMTVGTMLPTPCDKGGYDEFLTQGRATIK